jgi:hypothetical protein
LTQIAIAGTIVQGSNFILTAKGDVPDFIEQSILNIEKDGYKLSDTQLGI